MINRTPQIFCLLSRISTYGELDFEEKVRGGGRDIRNQCQISWSIRKNRLKDDVTRFRDFSTVFASCYLSAKNSISNESPKGARKIVDTCSNTQSLRDSQKEFRSLFRFASSNVISTSKSQT